MLNVDFSRRAFQGSRVFARCLIPSSGGWPERNKNVDFSIGLHSVTETDTVALFIKSLSNQNVMSKPLIWAGLFVLWRDREYTSCGFCIIRNMEVSQDCEKKGCSNIFTYHTDNVQLSQNPLQRESKGRTSFALNWQHSAIVHIPLPVPRQPWLFNSVQWSD